MIVLASLFLLKCAGKTSSGLIFVVLALTSLTAMIRSFSLRAIMLLAPLVILTLLSIGTVMSDQLAEIAKLLPLDTSFTGRTDIWAFSLQALQAKLLTGYGFAAFWGSGAIRDLPQGMEWTEYASHSHNGYLDTALSMGLPGTLLLIAVFVIAPLARLPPRRARRQWRAAGDGAAADLAVRNLSVLARKLLPRSRRSDLVHVPVRGVRPALSGAVPRQGVNSAAIACAASRHQPSKSNGTGIDGRFAAATILSA